MTSALNMEQEQSKHQLSRGAVYQLGALAAQDPLYREALWQVEPTWTPLVGGIGSHWTEPTDPQEPGVSQSCMSLHSGCLHEKVLIHNLYFTVYLFIFEDMT